MLSMKKINLLPLLFLIGLAWMQLTQSSCVNDKLPEPGPAEICDSLQVTYDNQVEPIIAASCSFSGCHAVGAPIGDYTDYVKMLPILNDNGFKKRVIEIRDMPDDGTTLSAEDYQILECWASTGYPEN